jgi:TolB-like protein/Tfp pilus assembly protein PilF
LHARYQGREAALTRANAFISLLKTELDVEPDPETKLVIDEIRRGAVLPTITSQNDGRDLDETISVVPTSEGEHIDPRSGAHFRGRAARWSLAAAAVGLMAVISIFGIGILRPNSELAGQASRDTTPDVGVKPTKAAAASAPGLIPIVVLPFTSDDGLNGPNQKVADIVTDDLINTLSRFAITRVVSRQTAFTYQGHPMDIADIGSELGVRYAVEGSFRTDGSKSEVNFQLVDTANRLELWSDHVEWDGTNRFSVQDEIATRIARELKIEMTIAEGERSADNHARAQDVDALVMRGLALQYRAPSRENVDAQLALFEEALSREPDLQPAMIGVATALTRAVLSMLADDPERNLARADELLDRALELNPNSYRVYYWKGLVYEAKGDYEAAVRSLTKCIEINPSAAYGHSQLAEVLTRLGEPQQGLDHIQYAMRLSPKDPGIGFFYIVAGEAELELHHDQAAVEWLRRAVASQPKNPSGYQYLAATYALMGDRPSAAKYWDEFRSLSAAPAISQLIARLKTDITSKQSSSRLEQGLWLALTS